MPSFRRLFARLGAGLVLGSGLTMAQADYQELVALFNDWRAFEHPGLLDGAPDYTEANLAAQLDGLAGFRQRLDALNPDSWEVDQQIDYYLVWAEMNGLDFYLRVLKPWANDPGFYASVRSYQSDTPAEEGPTIHNALRLWEYPVWPRTAISEPRPLNAEESARLGAELRVIPPLLKQARSNLTGQAGDLWSAAVASFDGQIQALDRLKDRLGDGLDDETGEALAAARHASVEFRDWISAEAPQRTGRAGVGRDHYSWHLRHVLLVNSSFEDEFSISERELARAHRSLRLAELRHRDLPELAAADSPEAFAELQAEGITAYIDFMDSAGVVTIRPWYDRALRERVFDYVAPEDRHFFFRILHYSPKPLWAHFYHYWDLEQMVETPHPSPIRRGPLLYNVWMSRAEGVATGMEEWTMDAGLYADNPRVEEIVWIMLATRAARGLASLKVHDQRFTMAEASDFHVRHTPRGWMRRDSLLGFEQQLYLQQPGYGTSYVTGARIIDDLIRQRAEQQGEAFTMREFFDDMNDAGMIPVSLLRWALNDDDSDLRAILASYTPLGASGQ
ncbi:MAG: DUF885 family protein [Wenzhouxiangella sp.]|nr:MAG: DUF885 family protein [Wenzhouxiangella sp.]